MIRTVFVDEKGLTIVQTFTSCLNISLLQNVNSPYRQHLYVRCEEF